MPQVDHVLVQITTAANMAGIEQAKAGMLGMNFATLGLAAGLGIAVMGAKSMIEISEKHEGAMKGLNQAYDQAGLKLSNYKGGIGQFIDANAKYITSQSDVIDGYATLTRSGLAQTEVTRDMNIAVDLSALKHISLTEAVDLVNKAEHGRMRGLVDLGIVSKDQINANGDLIAGAKGIAGAMDAVEKKTADGRNTISDLNQHSNQLNKDWQDLAIKGGPVLTTLLDQIVTKVTAVYDWFDKIGKDDKLWSQISDRLVNMAQWIKQYIMDPMKEFGTFLNTDPQQRASALAGSGSFRGGYRAAGGPVYAGGAYTVGERGPETLVMGARGGTVIPGTSGGSAAIHIHMDGIYAGDGASLDLLANRIAQRLRYAPGS